MPNCDFYALAPDLIGVLDFVFAQSGWLLIELGSEPDQPLREFRATRDVLDAYPAFNDLETKLHFQIYSEAMGGGLRRRRIEFKPGAVPGATFRYNSEGWGLIQLYFGALRDGRLSSCHTNHNTEKRARKWESIYLDQLGPITSWNWTEVARASGRLNRFIRSSSPGKVQSRPVMCGANEARARGDLKFERPFDD